MSTDLEDLDDLDDREDRDDHEVMFEQGEQGGQEDDGIEAEGLEEERLEVPPAVVRRPEFEIPTAGKTRWYRVAIVLAVVAGGLFAVGYLRNNHHPADQDGFATVGDTGLVRVQVGKPKPVESDTSLVLPGVVTPLAETQLYPHTAGYVRSWHVDIGDKVKEGQLLAEINAPELDAQLAQAKAQLAQANAALAQMRAQATYSHATASRYHSLSDQQLVAKAQVEQVNAQDATDVANVAAARAAITAQAANVKRLAESLAYLKVTAPFAGTITQRNIELGTLVSDGKPLMFNLVATDPVRVFLEVPQSMAPSIRVGTEVKVTTREYGDKHFIGKVTRMARVLDPQLHTMTTEIQVPNGDGLLMSGMYVQAQLDVTVTHVVLEIPATALYTDVSGVRVAKIDARKKIRFQKITIERDTGATVQIASGLNETERFVRIAVPTLVEGESVEIVIPPKPPSGTGSGSGSGSGSDGSAGSGSSGSPQSGSAGSADGSAQPK